MPQKVYDPRSDDQGVPRKQRDVTPGLPVASGDSSHPLDDSEPTQKKRGFGFSSKSTSPEGNFSASSSATKPKGASKRDLAKAEGEGGLYTPEPDDGKKKRSRFRFTKKRAAAAGGIAGTSIFVTVMFSGVSQGPLQFVHMSQLLQRFHFTSNQDFGDDRTAKYLFYAMAGNAENGRLGVGGNYVANRFETNLRKQGIQPVYDKATGRLVGFAVDDKNVADAMRKDSGDRSNIKRVSEARDIKGSKKHPDLNGSNYFVDLRGDCDFKCRRAVVKNVLQSTHTSKVKAAVAYRLLIKRGGIDMHPLNKYKQKAEESNIQYIKRILKRDAEETQKGKNEGGGLRNAGADANGNEVESDADSVPQELEEKAAEGNSDVNDAAGTGDSTNEIFRKVLSRGGGGALIMVGALCAAQDFGDSVATYKYTNSMLPMMRMGSKAVSMGDQVKSNDDISTDALKPYAYRMHDSKAPRGEQSWTDAKSIQAELGEPQTGPDLPEEAQLGNINDKPAFFDLVNKVPGLSPVCSVQDTFSDLPIISDISEAASAGIKAGAEQIGIDIEELAARALSMVAGNTVNPFAKGAEYGNLANVGAFVAGNENARTSGGAPLADEDVALLKAEVDEDVRIQNSKKSIAQRYLDIYDADSFAGSLASEMPSSTSNVASLMTNVSSAFSSSLYKTFALASPKAKAATSNFNYGMPKYGFSPSERDNPAFDDPYKNAVEIEESGKLDELNEKYGKNCFGMTVTQDATVESEEQNAESSVNPFRVMDEHPECDPKNNNDPWFLKYRFYLTDASVNTSMTCYFGNADSCATLGFTNTEQSVDAGASEEASGTIDMATLYESSVNIACPPGTGDAGIQDGYTEGNKVRIRTCTISNAPSSASDSKDGKLVMNSRVSKVVFDMMKAAKAAGVDTTVSSGFRSMATQECLAAGGCGYAGGDVADPGTSNHQMGIALDTSGSLNAWLRNNGERFGFKWYGPGDEVHFSPTGR